MAEAGAPRVVAVALLASCGACDCRGVERAGVRPGGGGEELLEDEERQTIYDTPAVPAELRDDQRRRTALAALAAQATDPEREFETDLCWNGNDGCAGDVRLYDWESNGYGIVQPVLFTARNGATLSGHVWATKAGRRSTGPAS